MKSIYRFLAVSLITITFGLNVHASEFTFYGISSTPATFKEGNTIKGYYAEVLQVLGKRLGLSDVTIKIAPYPRIFDALNNNKSGYVVTILFPNPKFNDHVYQPTKVGYFKTGIISMPNNALTWDDYQNKKVATVKGASAVYGKKFHDLTESGDIKLISVSNYDQAINMLKGGRIDGFAGNLGPTLVRLKSQGINIAEPAVITEKVSSITVSVAPGTPNADETVAKIQSIVDEMIAKGEVQDIIEKYLPDETQPR